MIAVFIGELSNFTQLCWISIIDPIFGVITLMIKRMFVAKLLR